MITLPQFVLAQAMMCPEPNPVQWAAIVGVVGIALVGLGLSYAIIAGVATIIVQQILAGASIAVILTAVQAFLVEHGVALLSLGPIATAIQKIQQMLGC